ncbi:MAG: aminopeptidase [Alcanivoracaceae bacterium]|nr:aminopeptidase [Alcanivoracaceae bacterium]
MRRLAVVLMRMAMGAVLGVGMAGCQMGYYAHLVSGHQKIMRERVPVSEILAGEHSEISLTETQRKKLQLSESLRIFAEDVLLLPVDDAYTDYVSFDSPPLQRGWATWNVFAAPALSLTPKTWCYPIAGCATYRGYFDVARANRDAEKLRDKGFEVYAAGAIAYSTLGWFDDPLTTLMLAGDDADFAELLFHELAHRRLYVKGNTEFNESLATSVARAGVKQWRAQLGADNAAQDERLQRRDATRRQVVAMVDETRAALESLYTSDMPEERMLAQRDVLREALRQQYSDALADNPDLARYQRWFDGPLNNAQLNTVADYENLVPRFDAILSQCVADWACFWTEVERIADLPAE